LNSIKYLKSISNNTKLRLVSLLVDNELCVCELEEITSIRQVNISKNLISLKDAGIVDSRKEKQRAFYFLSKEFASQIHLVKHIRDLRDMEEILKNDFKEFLRHEDVKDNNVYICNVFRKEEIL
jgi:ArsR family transcriptional regulator